MSEQDASRGVMFGGVFRRGGVDAGDQAWLRAMLDVEAALARALERAGLAPRRGAPGGGAARAGELRLPLPVLPWHTSRLRMVELAVGADAVLGKIARDVTLLSQSEVVCVTSRRLPAGRPS